MPNEEFDPFALSSGLADDFNFTFKNVHFGTDAGYVDNAGDMPVILIVDIVTDDEDAGTIENQNISIGKGWKIEDRGAYVTKNGSMEVNFNKQSYVGKILQAAFECDGGEDALRGRWEKNKLVPQQAAFWEGLRGHMKTQTVTNNIGGVKTERDKLFPTAIYGWDEDAPKAEKKVAKRATKKKAAEPVAAEPATQSLSPYQQALSEVAGITVAKLKLIAGESDNSDEFIDRAYKEIDGIDEDEQIMLLVDNTDDPETIWAVAVKEYDEANPG